MQKTVFGNKRVRIFDCDFDSSYPTGGEVLLPGTIGLSTIDVFLVEDGTAYTFKYNRTTKKLLAYSSGVEVTAATDLSAVLDTRCFVIGL